MAVQHELQIRLTADGTGLTGVLRTATGDVHRFSTDSVAANEKAAQAFGKTRQGVQSISEQLDRARTQVLAFFGLKFTTSSCTGGKSPWGDIPARWQKRRARRGTATPRFNMQSRPKAAHGRLIHRVNRTLKRSMPCPTAWFPVHCTNGDGLYQV